MIKIEIDNLADLQNLFTLLRLPGKDKGLAHQYHLLIEIVSDKEYSLKTNNFDQAAELRQKELKSIKKILTLLDDRGITNKGWLNIFLQPQKNSK